MAKNFDIYDFVHNNKITLKVDASKGTTVSKGYNDIRKTGLNEVKIVDGKFSIAESLESNDRGLSTEVKKHFLEIISTYNTFQNQMKRQSDLTEVANTLGGIVEAAKEMTLRESGDWFDAVTVKRNMTELDKLGKSFDKFAVEAKAMDERLHSLYEDMGHILGRYYEIADISEETMNQRLGKSQVSESFKHIITVDTPTQIISKPIAAEIEKLARNGVRAAEIGLKMNFVGNQKHATDAFQKIKNQIYFKLGKK
jgi:hypothetical protein